jgi:beta-lactamase superfamily II metal-dependent hydrolase
VKLRVFHANDGDCILLSSNGAKPRHMLFDGGRAASFEAYTSKQLAALATKLDVVCVSHVDDDHLSGILRMIEHEIAWRVHEIVVDKVKKTAKSPKVARPPEIGEIWHNNLFELVGKGVQPKIEPVLGSVAALLAGAGDAKRQNQAYRLQNLAAGYLSSMELARRISDDQLGIPLNPRAKGKLLKRKTSGAPNKDRWSLGPLTLSLLGPTQRDIDSLRVKWQEFLDDEADKVDRLHHRMREDDARFGLAAPVVANPLIDLALGERWRSVTPANVASLMFLVEEGGKRVLMTGDGRSQEILAGLQYHQLLDAHGHLHVDVLKVQHHGAKGNVTEEFVASVTADHYLFCGNGSAGNPELEVVREFARARTVDKIGPNRPFTFWFTSSSAMKLSKDQKAHMKMIEAEVDKLKAGTKMRVQRLAPDTHFELEL